MCVCVFACVHVQDGDEWGDLDQWDGTSKWTPNGMARHKDLVMFSGGGIGSGEGVQAPFAMPSMNRVYDVI